MTEDDIQQQYYDDCNTNDKLLKVTEGEVAEGDVVNIDYVGSIDGVEFDGGTDKGVDLTIGSGTFHSWASRMDLSDLPRQRGKCKRNLSGELSEYRCCRKRRRFRSHRKLCEKDTGDDR